MYVENVKKIAILRANALGDFIVILPAVHAIKVAYPHAELILLGKPWHKEFLKNKRTPFNRVIIIPVSAGIREEQHKEPDEYELQKFYEDIKKEKIDIAISFHGKGIAANPFIKKTGAKLTVGLTCKEAEKPDRSIEFYYYQNEVIRYLEVAALIGANPLLLEPEIKILKQDLEEAKSFIDNNKIKKIIVIHPCGMDKRRMWPLEKFAQLGDLLEKKNFSIVFSGNDVDKPTVNKIISSMKRPAINSCGQLSLNALSGIFAHSSLVISIDTGILHLARAAGVKTVGIYWAPNLINWGPLTRTKHRPVISWELECPTCGIIPNQPFPFEPESSCTHPHSFISNISTEEVFEASLNLLEE